MKLAGAAANKKIAGLDNLRAFAILFVLLFHYRLFDHPQWIDDAGSFGWTGVDLFFVLSGFLIAGQLFKQIAEEGNIKLKAFYLKRFFRIIPAYLFILALYFIIPGFKERPGLSPLWKYLSFTQNFGLNLGQTHAFTHAWSLCIEEQFYLFLPFILLCFIATKKLKWGAYFIAGMWIAGFFIRAYNYLHFILPLAGQDGMGVAWYQYIYYPTYNRLDGLLTGISVAAIFQFAPKLKERLTKYGNLILLAGLLLMTWAYFLCENQMGFNATVWGFPLVSLAYGLIMIASLSHTCILSRINSRLLNTIATLSYSIYLSHKAIFHITQGWFVQLGIEPQSIWGFILCMAMAIYGGFLLRQLVEKPFLKLRDRILARKQRVNIETKSIVTP